MSEETTTVNYEETALVLKEKVDSLAVVDQDSANIAESIEKTAKDNYKRLWEHMDTTIKEAHTRHKKLTETRKRLCDPFDEIARNARRKRIDWTQEEQRKAQVAMRKAEDEARKQAEEERITEAEQLEKQGLKEEASAVLDAPVAPVFVPQVEAPSVKGARTKWGMNIVDVNALFKALPDSPFMPDLTSAELEKLATLLKLTRHATSLKSNFKLAGIEVYNEVI